MLVGARARVVTPDPDCPRHGIRPGITSIPHLRRHSRPGEDNRSTEARLYAESFARRSPLHHVDRFNDEGRIMAAEKREGRKHEVAEVYVPTIHGEPAEGYLHEAAPKAKAKKDK